MKKAIVTGANGFVGSALVKELVKNNIFVYALDLDNNNDNIIQSELVEFIPFDLSKISNLENQLSDCGAHLFFHLAWAGSAGSARANTNLQLQNVQWTIDALKTAKQIGCSRFICAGSIMEHETIAVTYEDDNKSGLGYIYGGAKLAAHTMCKPIASDIGIDLIWATITNAYGAGEKSPRMVNTTIRKIIKGQSPQFTSGTQNYDFVYIDDVARAFYLIGEKGKPFNDYLIGSSSARPLKEFLLEMKSSIAQDIDFIFGDVPFSGTALPLSKYDCSKTFEDTGFKAEISFAKGTKLTRDWIMETDND